MTAYTSGTQALQGRMVNHERTCNETLSGEHRFISPLGYTYCQWCEAEPRPEYAVTDNPVLAEFRKIKHKYGTTAESAQWCLDKGIWEPDSVLLGGSDVVHAYRVLTRLAALEATS